MDIKDYKFKVGDEVITTEGIRGEITDICKCTSCQRRGFYEPTWVDDDGYYEYITNWDKECTFKGYYKIGDYYFEHFDKGEVLRKIASHERSLKKLKKQLRLIKELEGGERN